MQWLLAVCCGYVAGIRQHLPYICPPAMHDFRGGVPCVPSAEPDGAAWQVQGRPASLSVHASGAHACRHPSVNGRLCE